MPWQAEAPQAGFSTTEPWLPVDPRHFPLAVDRQEADPTSPLAFTRRWLAWRKTHSALKDGEIRFMDVAEPLLAFERWNAEDHVLCLFNLSDTEVKLTPAHAKAAGAETLAAYGFTVIAGADRFTADAPGTDDPARAERR
jgi:alpha-glucosidase